MRSRVKIIIALLFVVLFLASCSNEESRVLEEGRYPLELRIVNPPTSRAIENSDGSATLFSDGDVIKVRVEDYKEEAEYILTVVDGVVSEITPRANPIYWKDTKSHEVIAWLPADDQTIDLSDQSKALAYVLKGSGSGSFGSGAVKLTFSNQLSKIRVVLGGTAKVDDTTTVLIHATSNSLKSVQGSVTELGSEGWIETKKMTYGSSVCYEANVAPGTNISKIQVGEVETTLNSPVTAQDAGVLYTINLGFFESSTTPIDLSKQSTISDSGTYYITGSYTNALNITGGSPTVYFENVDIAVAEGGAVNITNGASPTLFMIGSNSVAGGTESSGAGIYVSKESSVVITGSSIEDSLEATSKFNGAGIGGYDLDNKKESGAITIQNVSLTAQGQAISTSYPGIGGSTSSGAITIENAAVTSVSGMDSPAIGIATSQNSNIPKITITNSIVHAYRYTDDKSGTDYIGQMASSAPGSGYYQGEEEVQLGQGGNIANSRVYCYTTSNGAMNATYDKVYINATGLLSIADDDNYVVVGTLDRIDINGNSNVTIKDATIKPAASQNHGIVISGGSPVINIIGSSSISGYRGVYTTTGGSLTITLNDSASISDTFWDGIYLYGGNTDIILNGTSKISGGQNGISVSGSGSVNITLYESSSISGISWDGVSVTAGSSANIILNGTSEISGCVKGVSANRGNVGIILKDNSSISSTKSDGISVTDGSADITLNVVSKISGGSDGISVYGGIADITLNDASSISASGIDGIYISESGHAIITLNEVSEISSNVYGVSVDSGMADITLNDGSSISGISSDIYISESGFASISLKGSNNPTIEGNNYNLRYE